jgi:hypothetical protein
LIEGQLDNLCQEMHTEFVQPCENIDHKSASQGTVKPTEARPAQAGIPTTWWLFAILIGMGLVGLVLKTYWAESALGLILILPVGMLVSTYLSVLLHEMGHAFCGMILGLKPYALEVGSGQRLLTWRTGDLLWIINGPRLCGKVSSCYPVVSSLKLRMALMVCAGPLVTLLTALICGTAFLIFHNVENEAVQFAGPFLLFTCLYNAWLFLDNLWPRYESGGRVPNDSKIILQLRKLTAADLEINKVNSEMHHWLLVNSKAFQENTNPVAIGRDSWRFLVDVAEAYAVARFLRHGITHPGLSAATRNEMLDSFSTWAIFKGDPDYLAEADCYSQELLESCPDDWSFKGTRGSVLVCSGRLAAGSEMLREVFTHSDSVNDRAISAAFLALAEFKSGNTSEARTWLEKAAAQDQHAFAIECVNRIAANAKG